MERHVKDGGNEGDAQAATPGVKSGSGRKQKSEGKDEAHLSNVLKSVYQRTMEEDIPSEMLDLLRKLD